MVRSALHAEGMKRSRADECILNEAGAVGLSRGNEYPRGNLVGDQQLTGQNLSASEISLFAKLVKYERTSFC